MKDARKNRLKRQRRLQQHQRGQTQAEPLADPIIGYVALLGNGVVCDGDACIVVGTPQAMRGILRCMRCDLEQCVIEPAHSLHILRAIALGGAYAFDQLAYSRFLPEALKAGLPLVEEDFSNPGPMGIHLVRVGSRN